MSFAQASLHRVQRELTSLIAGACAASLLAVGWYAYASYKSGLLEQTGNYLELVAARQQAAVLSAIGGWQHQVEFVSDRPELAAAVRAYLDGGQAHDRAALERVLADARSAVPNLRDLAILDRDGHVLASTDDELVGRDLSGRPEFTRGQTATTIGELVPGATGAILITATSPLRLEGQLAGVVWARLDARELLRITQDYTGLGETGEILLAERSWRGDAVLVSPARFDREAAFHQAIRPNRLDRPMTHALRKNAVALLDGVVDYRGVPVVAATRYLPEVDWGIVAKIDRREALQPAAALRDRLGLVALAVFVVTLIAAKALGAHLVAPFRQMRNQIDAILTSVADGLVTIDGKGRILSANPAAKVIFGYPGDELIGRNVSVLMPPSHASAHDGYLDAYRRTRVAKAVGHRREVEGRRQNGGTFPLEIAVSEVVIGGRQCFTGVVVDVSARKRAEKEIERQSAALVRANEELASRNQELARLSQTAHQFIDNVSHDFRTPLSVIKEYAAIVRDGSLGKINDDQAEFLDTIVHRTADLNLMVNDVLDLSKLDAGLFGVARRPCSLEQIVAGCRPILQSQAKAARGNLELALAPGLPEVFGDPEKVGRVIVNLGVNAFKFADEGGCVRVWARYDPEAAQVVIGVTDDGPGISSDNLRAIFERFRQVGDVQKSAKGFGLGLAIVKELVELNLGDVSVESREGEGSTFWFTVPTAEPLPLLRRFLAWTERLRSGARYLTLIAADLDAQTDRAAVGEIDNLLRRTLRSADLVLPPQGQRWLAVAAIEQPDPSGIHHRIAAAIEDANRHRSKSALPLPRITGLGTWSLAEGGAALSERFEAEYGDASRLAHRAA